MGLLHAERLAEVSKAESGAEERDNAIGKHEKVCLLCVAQILVIAVLMKWVLKRTFSVFQWEALLLLVAGITVNQLNYCK